MAGHFVFVRFFVGYLPAFPFDRFTHLKDDEISSAIEALRKKWLSTPANARRAKASRSKSVEPRGDWSPQWIMSSYLTVGELRVEPFVGTVQAQPPRTQEPSFQEVAILAGWWRVQERSVDAVESISHRFPVVRYSTKKDAQVAAEALQDRVAELSRCSLSEADWSPDFESYLHAIANPRFVAVAEGRLSRSELVGARERLQRLDGTAGKLDSPEEAWVRIFLPKLRPTLDQIEALSAPGRAAAEIGGSPVTACTANRTTPADSVPEQKQLQVAPPCNDPHPRHVNPEAADAIASAASRISGNAEEARDRAPAETKSTSSDTAAAEKPVAEKCKPRRGRKPDTDPKADQRIADAWGDGSHRTYEDCARELGVTKKEVKRAIDRHRHRTAGKGRSSTYSPE